MPPSDFLKIGFAPIRFFTDWRRDGERLRPVVCTPENRGPGLGAPGQGPLARIPRPGAKTFGPGARARGEIQFGAPFVARRGGVIVEDSELADKVFFNECRVCVCVRVWVGG